MTTQRYTMSCYRLFPRKPVEPLISSMGVIMSLKGVKEGGGGNYDYLKYQILFMC